MNPLTFGDSREGWDRTVEQLPGGARWWIGIGGTVQALKTTGKQNNNKLDNHATTKEHGAP